MIREGLKFGKSHEWAKFTDGGKALVGISFHAQKELGDIVYVNLPSVGDEVKTGEVFADVESVKAVSDVYAPVSGTVSKINSALLDAPEKINEDPYAAWFIEVENAAAGEPLMSEDEYEAFLKKEG